MTNRLQSLRTLFTAIGGSLPTSTSLHRGMFAVKKAASTEDELHVGLRDSAGVMLWRRLLTKTFADTLYQSLTVPTSPIVYLLAGSATVSNATDSYVTYLTQSVVLTTGTWTVSVNGDVTMRNSSAVDSIAVTILIDGSALFDFIVPHGVTSLVTVSAYHLATSKTGTFDVLLQFRRSGGSGTVTAECGKLNIVATRTA